MHGEDRSPPSLYRSSYGAPPRAWGGPARRSTCTRRTRSTPTCVGRTRRTWLPRHRPAEHPHVRGEDRSPRRYRRRSCGAPPRAWGGHDHHHTARGGRRSTPTCVGRTASPSSPQKAASEHPHVRGEDQRGVVHAPEERGAPPRAWGGPQHPGPTTRAPWSTPTCVGRTSSDTRAHSNQSEHPHVRGEDGCAERLGVMQRGAPPRAWGGPVKPGRGDTRRRSTPTCVGRTRQRRHPHDRQAEHPHVRGEDRPSGTARHTLCGAPPRAWGGQPAAFPDGVTQRSTPTCVGRTPTRPDPGHPSTEHPTCVGRTAAD